MRDVLLAVACIYFGITSTIQLAKTPFSAWGAVQWLLLVVVLLLFLTGGFKAMQAIRAMKVAQERARQEAERIQQEAAEEADAEDEAED